MQIPMSSPSGAGSPAAPDDRLLMAAILGGDDAAYAKLVRQNFHKLLAVTVRLLRDPDEAQDAVQDALISAYRHAGEFEGQCRLSTWLHRIAINSALMRMRSRKRRREESIEGLLPAFREDGHQVEPSLPWHAEAHDQLEREERAAIVRGCIAQLPEVHRTVLVLRDIEDLDAAETARLLRISPNAVHIRLHRARQALRALLDPHLRRREI